MTIDHVIAQMMDRGAVLVDVYGVFNTGMNEVHF